MDVSRKDDSLNSSRKISAMISIAILVRTSTIWISSSFEADKDPLVSEMHVRLKLHFRALPLDFRNTSLVYDPVLALQ